MKQIFLLFIYFSIVPMVYSQPFQSIYGDSSTSWSLVKEGYCDFVCSALYSTTSDTTIATNAYKILPNYGYIREDSTIGKVWFYDDLWNQEFLVMDLNLNIADTFTIYDWSGAAEIFTVDSINYNSGKKHLYLNGSINICGMEEPLVFVEGSGPNAGFNYQRLGGGSFIQSYMLCHTKNEVKMQGNTMFLDSCEICIIGIEELDNTQKELIKLCDYLGREIPLQKNTPLLYYYSDGTIRRVFIND